MRRTDDNALQVYKKFDEFIIEFLINKNSYVTDDKNILNDDNLNSIFKNFVNNHIKGTDVDFYDKLKNQLKNNDNILFANTVYLLYLATVEISKSKKTNFKIDFLNKLNISNHKNLDELYTNGILNGGMWLHRNRPWEIIFLLNLFKYIIDENINTIDEIKLIIKKICENQKNITEHFIPEYEKYFQSSNKELAISNILLHLVDPDNYEDIASNEMKKQIEAGFQNLLNNFQIEFKIDKKLQIIREILTKNDANFRHFYQKGYLEKWEKTNDKLFKPNFFYLVANPKIWSLDELNIGEIDSYSLLNENGKKRKDSNAFNQIKVGDLLLGYQSFPITEITCLLQCTRGKHYNQKNEIIEFIKIHDFDKRLKLTELKNDLILKESSFVKSHQLSLLEMNKVEFKHILGKIGLDYKDIIKIIDTSINNQITLTKYGNVNMLDRSYPLNQILYGPPGTGKTYHTINRALEIIEPNFDFSQNRNEIKLKFEEYVQTGRIVFTTFHQSLSYEDFIEGIKPDTENGNVFYNVKDGIFKKLVDNILLRKSNNINIFKDLINEDTNYIKVSLRTSFSDNDGLIYDYCINNNCIAIGWGENLNFTNANNEEDVKNIISNSGIEIKERDYNLISIKCLKFWAKNGDIVFVSNGNKKIRAIGIIDGDYYFNENTEIRFKQFRPVKWLLKDVDIDINLVYNKNFSQQTIYMLFNNQIKKSFFDSFVINERNDDNTNNYVLIIDEINRGNVSQIFGELITLIEKDKRIGEDEELRVTLPYSGDKFGVPSNLYIIGTMNTADRSVEALDTALRRRFSFEEMMPKYDVPGLDKSLGGHKLSDIMKTINDRIEMLLDRDHLIGHSYFMGINNEEGLQNTFKDKIIPLLQEYFYGDYGKIGLVLGEGFVKVDENKNTNTKADSIFAKFNYNEEISELIKPIYSLKEIDKDNIIDAINLLLNKKDNSNQGSNNQESNNQEDGLGVSNG